MIGAEFVPARDLTLNDRLYAYPDRAIVDLLEDRFAVVGWQVRVDLEPARGGSHTPENDPVFFGPEERVEVVARPAVAA